MKISIVTPTLNRRDYLIRTGESILSQTGPFKLEWLVVDGGSSDGTLEHLANLAKSDQRLRFVSEPDRGQSDAINKGLTSATGDVVAWLNADDLYAEGALSWVVGAFAANPDARWLVGRYEVIDEADRPIRQSIVRYKQRRLDRAIGNGSRLLRTLVRENVIPQPAVFWRRNFGGMIGKLDESLNWTMDYDLWLRMARISPPLVLDHLLARFRHHPASKSGAFSRRQFDEGYEVAKRHAQDDRRSLLAHRMNVEKIVWAYRVMRLFGR